jgi:hypothetical protein
MKQINVDTLRAKADLLRSAGESRVTCRALAIVYDDIAQVLDAMLAARAKGEQGDG